MGRTQRKRNQRKQIQSENVVYHNIIINLYKHLAFTGWRNEAKLSVRDFPVTGRGLYSKSNINKNDLLIKLPLHSLITLNTLEKDANFRAAFESAPNFPQKALSFQSLLGLFIVFHQHNQQSPYSAYIKSLPESFTNPFFCAKSELNFLPDSILKKIVDQHEEIKAAYKLLSTNMHSAICECCGQYFFPHIFDLEKFKWAYFTVNSRCVYIDPKIIVDLSPCQYFLQVIKDEPKFALAPFLDLFNHSDSAATTLNLCKNEPVFYELFTKKAYHSHEQIFISYGELPNSKLLIEYGFFLSNNMHDFFEFCVSDIELLLKFRKRIEHRNKFKFIKDHQLDQQMFVHCDDGASHNLVVVLYLLFVEQSVFPNTLSQVAFGASRHFEDIVKKEINALIQIKLDECKYFIAGLEKINAISPSGYVVIAYLNECITYLNKVIDKFYS